MSATNNRIILKGMTWDHARAVDPLIATSVKFNELHPEVEVVWEKRNLQAFADRPLEDMAEEFDFMIIDHPHAGIASRTGLLLPFNGQGYDDELAIIAKESCGVSHQSYEFEGQQWALAIDTATPISAYRPDLLKEIPEAWSQVEELAASDQVIWPLKPINALMSFYNVLANINEPFGENGIGVNPATGIKTLELMMSVAQYLPEKCFSMDPIDAYEWLATRSDRSYVPYLYGYTNYSREGYRPHLVNVADIPSISNTGPIGSPIGGAGIAISSSTKHKELALEYAYWITSAECQSGIYFQAGGQPGSKAAWIDKECNDACNNFFLDTLKTMEASYLRPRHDGYMEFQDIGGDLIHAYLTKQKNAEETIKAINNEYKRSFK